MSKVNVIDDCPECGTHNGSKQQNCQCGISLVIKGQLCDEKGGGDNGGNRQSYRGGRHPRGSKR